MTEDKIEKNRVDFEGEKSAEQSFKHRLSLGLFLLSLTDDISNQIIVFPSLTGGDGKSLSIFTQLTYLSTILRLSTTLLTVTIT